MEVVSFTPRHFTVGKRALGSRKIVGWGWGDPTADMEAVAERKKSLSSLYGESNPGRPTYNLVTVLTWLSRLHQKRQQIRKSYSYAQNNWIHRNATK
jgi:hypothetical protein